MSTLTEQIRSAGVVGAGGAGFPTYKKLEARVEIVIANGAECEPLFEKDMAIIRERGEKVLKGLKLVQQETGAKRAIFGIKGKHGDEIEMLRPMAEAAEVELHFMDDVYPAGDEFELVFSATGRLIPTGGIPLQIGVVVNNVESLMNIYNASQGIPVTKSMITVAGAVKTPKTFWAPVGMTIRDVLAYCGGTTTDDFAVIDGGAMMGKVETDLDKPITKTGSGYIVLPADHRLIWKKSAPERTYKKIGKSACDQCSDCTELCPRYLLGQPVKPHLVMRALEFSGPESDVLNKWALACCECNICSLYACPEELDPRNMCVSAKRELKPKEIKWTPEELVQVTREEHPLHEYRKVPTNKLIQKLGLRRYADKPATFDPAEVEVLKVKIPLKQHIGVPANPLVKKGDQVVAGDKIGVVPSSELGADVHASITGTVTDVSKQFIVIEG